jgi:hypothetical protein
MRILMFAIDLLLYGANKSVPATKPNYERNFPQRAYWSSATGL